jgi:hypothetical protein
MPHQQRKLAVPIASQLRTFGSLVSGRVLEPVLARAFPVARAVIVFEIIGKFGFVLPDLQSGIEERVKRQRWCFGQCRQRFTSRRDPLARAGFREIATLPSERSHHRGCVPRACGPHFRLFVVCAEPDGAGDNSCKLGFSGAFRY